jgi:Ca2+/Na+ antiporter
MRYREIIIQQLIKILGYEFSEKELSPDTRKKIGELENYYAKLMETYERINLIKKEQETSNKCIFVFIFLFFLGVIFIQLSLWAVAVLFFLLSAVVILYWISSSEKVKKRLEMESNNYHIISSEYDAKLKELASYVHEELKEIHQLKLRPERVEYKVVVSYSMDRGVLEVSCPYCGASIQLDKSKVDINKYKCQYCGRTFIIPKKILDLL